MRATSVVVALALSLAACGRSSPTPLDNRPALKSEIQRGWSAGELCSVMLPTQVYQNCIIGIQRSEAARTSNANPFSLGLFLNAWFTGEIRVEADEHPPINPVLHADLPAARRWAATNFVAVRCYQRKVGVSDEQTLAIPEANINGVAERWADWLRKNAAGDDHVSECIDTMHIPTP